MYDKIHYNKKIKKKKKKQLKPYVEQQTGSKLGKEYVKAIYCHPIYLTCMQSTSYEMPGWMNHKLELRLPGEISITSNMLLLLLLLLLLSHFSHV